MEPVFEQYDCRHAGGDWYDYTIHVYTGTEPVPVVAMSTNADAIGDEHHWQIFFSRTFYSDLPKEGQQKITCDIVLPCARQTARSELRVLLNVKPEQKHIALYLHTPGWLSKNIPLHFRLIDPQKI